MIRKITTLLLCAFVGITANASQITEQQALQVAAKYADIDIKSHPQRMKAARKQQKAAAYYAFNIGNNDGFVIVSGDDSLTELVGYSDSGSFDPDNMPDNMRSWLQAYSGYVASVQAGDSKAKRQQLGNVTTIVVRPFVTTEWNQGEPYDRLTPLLDNGAHCATGCVATAMAQVMKYYEWPERGEGSNSYEYDPYGTLSMDFSQSVYDWENMLDIYSSYYEEGNIVPEYNDGQAGAVAKLMYDCGISVNMMYGESSGAYDPAIPNAFKSYFKYKSDIYYRDNMSSKEFMDVLLSELDEKRPVLICGAGLGGGHAFVGDGYDSNNFVHINWGWGGYSDGYFNVNYLDPEGLGTGGGTGAFKWSQSLTTAYPNYTGETIGREQSKLSYYPDYEGQAGGIFISASEFQQNQKQEVSLVNIYNTSGNDYYGVVSAAIFDMDGNMVASGSSPVFINKLPSAYLETEPQIMTLDFSQLSDGEYEIYGISKENSDEYDYDWIKFDSKLHIKIRVGNGVVTVIPQEYSLSLTKQIEKPERIYMNGSAEFTVTISNNSSLTTDGYILYEIRKSSDGSIVEQYSSDAIIYDHNEYAAELAVPVNSDKFAYEEEYVFSVAGFRLTSGVTIPVESEFGQCTFSIYEGTPQLQLSFYDFENGTQPGVFIDAEQFEKSTPQNVNVIYALNPDMEKPFDGEISMAVCNADNQIVLYSPYSYEFDIEAWHARSNTLKEATPDMSELTDGLYSIIPVSMENGASEWVRFDYPAKIDIEIKGDYAYVRHYEYSISQESAITAAGELTSGGMGVFNVEMRNNSEEEAVGDLSYEIRKQADGSIVADGSQRVYLPAYTTTAISIEQLLADDIFSEGAYTIAITGYLSATHSEFGFATEHSPSTFLIGTSGADAIEAANVTVYPNPAQDYITVDCGERISNVTIFRASGQLVKSVGGADAEGSIHVGDLPAGYYIVAVDTESGATVRKQILKR